MSMSFPLGRRPAASRSRHATPEAGERDPSLEALEERLGNRNLIVGAIAAFAVLGLLVLSVTLVAVARDVGKAETSSGAATPAAAAGIPPAGAIAPALAADDPAAKDVEYEEFERVDPTLPDVPDGAVKRFEIDVAEHVTKVADGGRGR